MRRKIGAFSRTLLILALVLALLLPTQALAFSDVAEGDWYNDAVSYCES